MNWEPLAASCVYWYRTSCVRKEAAILTLQTRKRLGTAALCVGGAALLLHPACLIAFGAGAWAGSRGRDWLKRIWDDREAVL